MNFSLINVAKELLIINEDIRFRFKDYNTNISDFEMYDFEQVWGSTALGFDGIGGQAMTSARTYIFVPEYCNEDCFVYFAGRFAYSVPYSRLLMEDIINKKIEPKNKSGKYLSKDRRRRF